MYRVAIGVSNLLPLRLVEKRHIVLWRDIRVYVFQPDVHGANSNGKFGEARQEVEEVVGSQRQLGGLDAA
jgi:hypothetical protein